MKKACLLWCTITMGLVACQKDQKENPLSDDIELTAEASTLQRSVLVSPEAMNPPEAFPGQRGVIKRAYLDDEEITYEEINGHLIFEGDIFLNPEMLTATPKPDDVAQRTGLRGNRYRWKNKKVFYDINENLPNKQRVRDAIAHWEAKTSIKFIRRTNQPDYVFFTGGDGCASELGRDGGKQKITLAPDCTTGAAIHEIGHAVGLFHEQARSDRNEHLTIHWRNIEEGKKHNFETWKKRGLAGFDRGRLDFNSIMLYGPWSFSKNGYPTITKKDGSTYEYNYSKLSQGDINTVEWMYRNE